MEIMREYQIQEYKENSWVTVGEYESISLAVADYQRFYNNKEKTRLVIITEVVLAEWEN